MKKLPVLSKIKELPLQGWMTLMGSGRYSPPLAECSPAYNKDGYYYDDRSKLCWFEYNGKAWVYDVKMFQYDYEISHTDTLNREVVESTSYPEIEKYVKHFGGILLNHFLTKKKPIKK